MKIMIIEDDFTSRKMLQLLLSPYGICDIVVNGREAIEVFSEAFGSGDPYDLICLDLMLPGIDGHAVLKKIREIERLKGIEGLDGVKVIITTALSDAENVRKAFFYEQCEGYLVKPISNQKLTELLNKLGLFKN